MARNAKAWLWTAHSSLAALLVFDDCLWEVMLKIVENGNSLAYTPLLQLMFTKKEILVSINS